MSCRPISVEMEEVIVEGKRAGFVGSVLLRFENDPDFKDGEMLEMFYDLRSPKDRVEFFRHLQTMMLTMQEHDKTYRWVGCGTLPVERDRHYDRDGYCDSPARGY